MSEQPGNNNEEFFCPFITTVLWICFRYLCWTRFFFWTPSSILHLSAHLLRIPSFGLIMRLAVSTGCGRDKAKKLCFRSPSPDKMTTRAYKLIMSILTLFSLFLLLHIRFAQLWSFAWVNHDFSKNNLEVEIPLSLSQKRPLKSFYSIFLRTDPFLCCNFHVSRVAGCP